MTNDYPEPRQEKRDRKRRAERGKMAKHGKGLARVYKDALSKRLKEKPSEGGD